MEITKDTRVSEILEKYGDIADADINGITYTRLFYLKS